MTDPTRSAPSAATDAATDAVPVQPRDTGRRKVVRRTWIITVIVVVLLALGAGRTVMSRIHNSKSLEAGTVERAKISATSTNWEDAMLLSRAKMFQFVPAQRDGYPVRYRLLMRVDATP